MGKEHGIKETLLQSVIYLALMVLMEVLLVMLQAVMVYKGQLPLDVNLNFLLHFLVVASVGVVVNGFSKRNNLVSALFSIGALYILVLLLSIVVFDAFSGSWIDIFLGCVAGVVTVILSTLLGRRRQPGWKKKKYNC